MKKLFFLPLALLILFSCNFANENDIDQLAGEMCECWRPANEGVSEEGRRVIVDAAENNKDFEEALFEYGMDNPEQAEKDAAAIELIESTAVESCLSSLEVKYNDLYTTDSEAEITEKLLKAIKKQKNCEVLYGFVKIEQNMGY